MIPARMGSKRVKLKNLREIDGIPLIEYIITAAKKSGIFDEIYINSESEVFKGIAEKHEIKFYKRSEALAQDDVTNDAFAFDFLENVKCETLIQLLPTSPFISAETIQEFVQTMYDNKYETLISVRKNQIECVYDGKPVNFDDKQITLPSQQLEPVYSYACGIMGWNSEAYKKNYNKYKAAYHGGDSKIGTFVLSGYEIVDIDEESDFKLAEVIAKANKDSMKFIIPVGKLSPEKAKESLKQLFDSYKEELNIETDVPSILEKDGVKHNDLHDANKEVVNVNDIIAGMPESSWSKRLVDTESNSMCLICQSPGEGNRRHYHAEWNEWWFIIQGEWIFEVEDRKIIVKKGDLVFIEKGKVHRIEATGTGPAIRMAVSRADVGHIYVESVDPVLFNRMLR